MYAKRVRGYEKAERSGVEMCDIPESGSDDFVVAKQTLWKAHTSRGSRDHLRPIASHLGELVDADDCA